jgi:hypothetical protein
VGFKQFLTEVSSDKLDKLSHIPHVEDHLFHGKEGFHRAYDLLTGVHDRINGKGSTTKVFHQYDGNPSIIFGHHPETGKFFVGTRSALSRNPKIAHTHADVDKHYGRNEKTAKALHAALTHLGRVTPPTGVYQADVLYHEDTKIDDGKEIHFKPGSTLYTAEKKDPEFPKVKDGKFGVVVHTKFHGKDLDKMEAGHEPDLHNFGKHKHVHILNPEVPMDQSLGGHDLDNEFGRHMHEVDKAYRNAHPDTFKDTTLHATHLKRYVNQTSKVNEMPTPQGFKQHLSDLARDDVSRLRSTKTKIARKDELLSHLRHIDSHHEQYNSLLTMHHHMQQAKNVLVDSLSKADHFRIRDGEGLERSGMGLIATNRDIAGRFVDRAPIS